MAIYEPIEPRGPRRRYRLRSPVDREPIGELECMTESDVAARARARAQGAAGWAARADRRARRAAAPRARRACSKRHERITSTVIRETGKTETEAFGDGGVRDLRLAELLREERARASCGPRSGASTGCSAS